MRINLTLRGKKNKLFFMTLIFSSLLFWGAQAAQGYEPTAKVTFTFDDGHKRIYQNAAPIFSLYNMPAVLFGETGPLNSGEDWVMTWQQIRNLRDEYGWEIGSHTINHPYLTQLSDEQLVDELLGSKEDFAAQGIEVKSFASPYGDYDARVLSFIARYYESHRAAWGGANYWPYNDYQIVSREVSHTTAPATVAQWIDEAIANGQWLVLLLHDVVSGEAKEYEYNVDQLRQIVDYASRRPIKAVTITEGLRFSSKPNLVSNPTFNDLDAGGWANGWTRNDANNVLIDTNNNGNTPEAVSSLKIIGGSNSRIAVSGSIKVNPSSEYILRMYQKTQNLAAGGWAVYVDEYDSAGVWQSGQWLGGNYSNFIGSRYYSYNPTSPQVDSVKIQIFTEADSQLTLYVDSVEMRELIRADFTPSKEEVAPPEEETVPPEEETTPPEEDATDPPEGDAATPEEETTPPEQGRKENSWFGWNIFKGTRGRIKTFFESFSFTATTQGQFMSAQQYFTNLTLLSSFRWFAGQR